MRSWRHHHGGAAVDHPEGWPKLGEDRPDGGHSQRLDDQDPGTGHDTGGGPDDPGARLRDAAAQRRHHHDRLRRIPMAGPPPAKPANKLSNDVARVLPHLQLDEHGRSALAGCQDSIEALERLEKAALLIEATRLIAHALPARGGGWGGRAWSRHTAAPGTNLAAEAQVREAAEEWVRKQTDEHRRTAMKQAEATGFGSAEAWAAVGAFWSGDS